MTDQPTTSRKATAVAFLRQAATGQAREAFRAYTSAGFRHHNPFFRADAESLARAMDENAAKNPDKTLEVERALEDRDLVAVHCRVRLRPDQPEVAVVHLFRFEGDVIVELWDIAQPAPKDMVNERGMF
ncbi:MAG TPA: nuclear transport factor 2 family protein [Polyangia bacterium]|nr:nuclear transport factor 2 family protein [Polyangia bacterium]